MKQVPVDLLNDPEVVYTLELGDVITGKSGPISHLFCFSHGFAFGQSNGFVEIVYAPLMTARSINLPADSLQAIAAWIGSLDQPRQQSDQPRDS